MAVDKEVCGSREKFSGAEEGAEKRISPLRPRGSVELRKVASGFATQGFWLKNRKVGSQEVGNNRSRLPGRKTIREVGRGGR